MKATALLLAVFALLGMMVATDSALAGTINTSTTTLGSASFGFEPTAGNLQAFTRQTGVGSTYCQTPAAGPPAVCADVPQAVVGGGLTCVGAGPGLSCNGSNYVPIANSLPGALTSRPDKVVSTWTDFGCGDAVPTGGTCVEGPPATGINTLSRVMNAPGHNTAPLPSTCSTPPCAPDGTLTGTLNSVVTLDNLGTPDMPTGSIVFNWTPGVIAGVGGAADNNGSAEFSVDISHEVSGLYTFNEFDTTLDPVLTYASRDFENRPDAGGAAGTNFPDVYPTMDEVNILGTLTLSQNTLGGEGFNTENLGYSIRWGGSIGHPGGGGMFSPGLNIRDWNGNTPPAPAPNPPGDGLGFPN